MVLVVTPGAIISEIIYNDETLMYQISDLRNYQNYNEALMDIQNTFEFHQFNMIRKQEETIGILYFKSQTQAQEAQENLRQRPLIGKNGPILELKAIEKSMNQPCLKIIAAIHHQQLVKMLEYYGEPQYLNIKTLENSSLAYIRYRDSKSTELCFHEFNNWIQEDYGVYSSVHKLHDGIIVPKELLNLGLEALNEGLEGISMKYGVELYVSGKNVLRIYGEMNRLSQEIIERVLDLVNYETIPITLEIMKCLDKAFILYNGESVSWTTWQQENRVYCSYLHFRAALAIYGDPKDRHEAADKIQGILSDLLKQIYTTEISYSSIKEFRKIELFKKNLSQESQVEININRRKGSFTITGIKHCVDQALQKLQLIDKYAISDENCGICLDVLIDNPICLSLCGHRFHSNCLNFQINNAISESGISGFPINCAICLHPLTHNDWIKVLSYNELNNLFSASLIHFMSTNSSFSHCENSNCDFVYNIEKSKIKGNTRKCTRCKGTYCILCKRQVYGISHEIQCEMEKMKKIDVEDITWIEKYTVGCPRCNIRIEKNEGCNHLVCSRCSCHFCFICREEIFNLSPVDHYRQVGKICYQRYMTRESEKI